MKRKNPTQTTTLLSITERGKGKKLIELLDGMNIKLHLQFVGVGTASSDMMDILGLNSNDKDVILSFAPYAAVEALAEHLCDDFSSRKGLNGLLMVISPSAAGKLMSAIISHGVTKITTKEGRRAMETTHSFSLIIVAVNEGYSEEVMQTARRAGATGGTIIRARMDGTDVIEQAVGKNVPAEKEIITILASDNVRDKILEDINSQLGLRSEANGVVCSVPVDKAFKI